MIEAYKFSNKTGKFWPLILALGIPGAVAIAVVYAVLTFHVDNQFLRVVFCFLYFSAWGLLTGNIAIKSKCRNRSVLVWSTFFLAIISWYVNWTMFLSLFEIESTRHSFITLLVNPDLAYGLVGEIAENGRFYFDGESISTSWHWGIWIGESFVMLVLNPLSATGSTTNKIFCENCNNWLDHNFEIPLIQTKKGTEITKNPEFLIYRNDNGDLQINPEKIPSLVNWFFYRKILVSVYIKANIQHCNHCHETSTLLLTAVEVQVTEEKIDEFVNEVIDKENTKEISHYFGQKYLISKELYEDFLSKDEAYRYPGKST